MSDRFCAEITIGGRLPQSCLSEFLTAVADSGGSLEWGDARFEPASVEDITSALRAGRLVLYHDQACCGEFEYLEITCRKLGLSYTRWSEGQYEHDAELVDFRPGMPEPRVQTGSNAHPKDTLVPSARVREALECLEAGFNRQARMILQSHCPEIPELPPLELV